MGIPYSRLGTKEGSCMVAPMVGDRRASLLLGLVWLRNCLQDDSYQLGTIRFHHDQPHGHNASACPNYSFAFRHEHRGAWSARIISTEDAQDHHGYRLPRVAGLLSRRLAVPGNSPSLPEDAKTQPSPNTKAGPGVLH